MSSLSNKPHIIAILVSAATAAAISGVLFHIVGEADNRQFRMIDELQDKHAALDKEVAVLEERIRILANAIPEDQTSLPR